MPCLQVFDADVYVVRRHFIATEIRIQTVTGGCFCSGCARHGYLHTIDREYILATLHADAAGILLADRYSGDECSGLHSVVIDIGKQLQLVLVPSPANTRTVGVMVLVVVGEAVELVNVLLVFLSGRLVNRRTVEDCHEPCFCTVHHLVGRVVGSLLARRNQMVHEHAGCGFGAEFFFDGINCLFAAGADQHECRHQREKVCFHRCFQLENKITATIAAGQLNGR